MLLERIAYLDLQTKTNHPSLTDLEMYNSISSHYRMCWAGFFVDKSC